MENKFHRSLLIFISIGIGIFFSISPSISLGQMESNQTSTTSVIDNIGDSELNLSSNSSNDNQTNLSTLELSEPLENNVTSIVGVNATDANTTEINNLLSLMGPNVTDPVTTITPCNTIGGIPSTDIGLNDQIPCTVILTSPTKENRIDVDYQIIQNDDSDDITYFYHNQQIPDTLNLEPGELFVFTKVGGSEYDFLDVYLVDKNTDDGDIINLDNTQPARIFLEHMRAGTTDIFKVPEIDDGVSEWKMVISYEVNDELESTYIANDVAIE